MMPPMRLPSFGLQKPAAVGDNRHRAALQPRVGAEHLGRVLGLEFGIVAGVEDAADDFLDVVRQAVIGGQNAVAAPPGRAPERRPCRGAGVRRRQVGESAGGSARGTPRRPSPCSARRRSTAVCSRAPPSGSGSITWPVAPFTRLGPPSPMKLVPSTMMMTSLSAGRYAPPAMHGPITAAICGMRSLRRISEL